MSEIRVLWGDDECRSNSLDSMYHFAQLNGFELVGYVSAEEVIRELINNVAHYDAVLLDAHFFLNTGQSQGTENGSALVRVFSAYDQLQLQDKPPCFLLSGQTTFTKEPNPILEGREIKCYDKTKIDDVDQLFEDMRHAVENAPDIRLKQKYAEVLDICDWPAFKNKHFNRIFTYIKHIEGEEEIPAAEDMLTPMRKVIETLFEQFVDLRIVDPALTEERFSLTVISKFLSRADGDYYYEADFFSPVIAEGLYRLLSITQDGSHGNQSLKLNVDAHLKGAAKPYLYFSMIYQLFDVLSWAHEYIRTHRDKDVNASKWSKKNQEIAEHQWLIGQVESINEKGWGQFVSDDKAHSIGIPRGLMATHQLTTYQRIRLLPKDAPSKNKLFVDQIDTNLE